MGHQLRACTSCSVEPASITPRGQLETRFDSLSEPPDSIFFSYVEMIRSAAASFPPSVFEPPPEAASNMPSLNLNLGGVNVSLGGPAGTGVYRTSDNSGVNIQTDGIRDGVKNLFGKVKQGVDRIASQQ